MPTNLTVEITDRVKERLQVMQKQVGADSLIEVVRRALAVYDAILKQKEEGNVKVLFRHEDGTERELLVR